MSFSPQKLLRASLVVVCLFTISIPFTNCSEQYTDSGLYGSACNEDDSCDEDLLADESQNFINPRTEADIMECTHDHIQVGGSCETNAAVDTYIEYSLTREGISVPWNGDDGSVVTILREARCENGRYYLIIPRPPDSVISESEVTSRCQSTSSCLNEYFINARLVAMKKDGVQYEVIATSPLLSMSVELLITTTEATYCPAAYAASLE